MLKSIRRNYSTADGPIWMKCGTLVQYNMPITAIWSRRKPDEEFQYGGHLFVKPEIVISEPRIELS